MTGRQTDQEPPARQHSWGPLLILLLCVETAYVAVEFAFNAAILNTASHAIEVTEHSVSWLTQIGQRLSGIGLALLILSAYFLRRATPPNLTHILLAGAIVIPGCIVGMTKFHNWLLHDYLPRQAETSELFAANYLKLLVPSIQTGLIGIEDLPIAADTLNRPESKALLTLLAPALLNDPIIADKIVKGAPDIIKFHVHKMAGQANPKAYLDYMTAFEGIDVEAIYDHYARASEIHRQWLDEQMEKAETSRRYRLHERQMGINISQYQERARKGTLTHRSAPPGLSPAEYLAHPKTLAGMNVTNPAVQEKIKPHHFRIHSYNPRYRSYQVDARAFYREVITQRAALDFAQKWNQEAGPKLNVTSDVALEPGLPKNELIASQWMQGLIRDRVPVQTNLPIIPGVSEDDFFARYTLPSAWDMVRTHLDDLPAYPSDVSSTNPRDSEALAALYGPAIALSLSLLFSLLTLGKIAGRAWMICRRHRAVKDQGTINGKRLITLASAIAIITLPLTMPTNSLARTDAIEAASKDHISRAYVAIMRWTLDVEPIIFPIGNALLPYLGAAWGLDQYADPNAGPSDTTSQHQRIETFALTPPLTVKELQSRLHDAGLNPGPIDGIIGQSTTRALRAFQSSRGLDPTGIQDAATIQALRQL